MADNIRVVSFNGATGKVMPSIHINMEDIPVAGFYTCLPQYGDYHLPVSWHDHAAL